MSLANVHQVQRRFAEGYAEAFKMQRSLVGKIEEAEPATARKPGVETANALGTLAWHALHVRKFSVAPAATERARALAPDPLWIETNHAHALLFLDRPKEASALYLAHRGKRIQEQGNKSWEDVIAEDFDALRAARVEHNAFGEIVAALGINPAQSLQELDALNSQLIELFEGGKYADALPIADKYVAVAKKRYGEDHSAYATSILNLAQMLQATNRLAEAEPLMRRAPAINEKSLGPEHPNVAVDLNNLAVLLQDTNRPSEAEPLMRRALAITEKSLGPNHPDVAIRLNNLAQLLKDTNRLTEAEALMRRALAINDKSLGPEHPGVAL